MTDKIEYKQTPFVSLWETSEMFSSKDDLLRALQDGTLKAQGRYSTDHDMADVMSGIAEMPDDGSSILYPYKDISPDEWQSFKIDWSNSCISMKGSTKTGLNSLIVYENVRLKRAELDLLSYGDKNVAMDKVESVSQEDQADDIRFTVIKPICFDLEKKVGKFPAAMDVWEEIKRRANDGKLPFEVTFEENDRVQKDSKIIWKNKFGNDESIKLSYFRDIVSKIKSGKL